MNFLRQSCRGFLFTLSSTGHSHIREWTHSILDPPSDGGLVLIRELEERLGLDRLIDEQVRDARQGENKKFPLADQLRQSVYIRLRGYEDLNDAACVSTGPGPCSAQEEPGSARSPDLPFRPRGAPSTLQF